MNEKREQKPDFLDTRPPKVSIYRILADPAEAMRIVAQWKT